MKELISSIKILHSLTKDNFKSYLLLIVSLIEVVFDLIFFYTFYKLIEFFMSGNSDIFQLVIFNIDISLSIQVSLFFLCSIFILRSLLSFWINLYIDRKAYKLFAKICNHFYEVFLFTERRKIGNMEEHEILTFFLSDLKRTIAGCFPSMLLFFRSIILIVIFISYLIISNIQNVFVIFSLIFSVILYLIIFNKEFFKKTSQNVRQFSFEMNKFGPLVLKFFKEIRIYNKEKVFFEKFKNIINLQVNTEIITKKINYGLRTFIEISFFFTTIIYFIYLLKVTNMENSIALFANLFVVMIRITPIFNIILRTYSDLKIRNANIIKTENYIKKFPLENQIYDYGNNFQKVEQVETFEIRNFNYNNSKNESIFKNAFFEFNRKQKIYINGNSGSGKTTLLDVISGINFDYNGTILINGKERSKVEAKNILKRRVGYVSQPAYLMPGSIKENITFAFSNDLIDKRRLDNALEKSGLLGELNKFKDGIETYLVTPMQNISEGQKQRIFIARSIYFERDIIVLDEATSGLDKKSEKSILQSLLKQENLTIILVSHHLTFLDGFDAVYKIQNCEILDEKKI